MGGLNLYFQLCVCMGGGNAVGLLVQRGLRGLIKHNYIDTIVLYAYY